MSDARISISPDFMLLFAAPSGRARTTPLIATQYSLRNDSATANDAAKGGIGFSTDEGWKSMQALLLKMGMLDAPVDVSKAYTNQFLK